VSFNRNLEQAPEGRKIDHDVLTLPRP
jgi:hypothetical protein